MDFELWTFGTNFGSNFEPSPMTGLYRLVHGTIIRTGGFLLKKLRHFEVMLSIYEFSRVRENVEF